MSEKISSAQLQRFNQIQEEIQELIKEALDIIPKGRVKDRAYPYWYAHIRSALDDEGPFLGKSMVTMQDTGNELKELTVHRCGVCEREMTDEEAGGVLPDELVCDSCAEDHEERSA